LGAATYLQAVAIASYLPHPTTLSRPLFKDSLRRNCFANVDEPPMSPETLYVDIYWEEGYIISCSGDDGMRGGIYE
jgi:hypothetical protein